MFLPTEPLGEQARRVVMSQIEQAVELLLSRNQYPRDKSGEVQGAVYQAMRNLLPRDPDRAAVAPTHPQASTSKWDGSPYGLGFMWGKAYCFACNKTITDDQSAQVDHILSDAHDKLVAKTGAYARGAGWQNRDHRESCRPVTTSAPRNSLSDGGHT